MAGLAVTAYAPLDCLRCVAVYVYIQFAIISVSNRIRQIRITRLLIRHYYAVYCTRFVPLPLASNHAVYKLDFCINCALEYFDFAIQILFRFLDYSISLIPISRLDFEFAVTTTGYRK